MIVFVGGRQHQQESAHSRQGDFVAVGARRQEEASLRAVQRLCAHLVGQRASHYTSVTIQLTFMQNVVI